MWTAWAMCACPMWRISPDDNAGESYAKGNGNDGVVLSFQKQSTASTATVSQRINSAIAQLQEQNPGLHITPLMDQGDYIDMVVGSVLSNLCWGGLLAIIVLIFFLKDAKPTFIVACSILFSLMRAITLMYSHGCDAEHHLAVGPCAGRACWWTTALLSSKIFIVCVLWACLPPRRPSRGRSRCPALFLPSTLTTICVFLPIVFTQGISRELFTDMA